MAVLIASASAGSGHLRAAEALEHALRRVDPDLDVMHVDVLRLASPLVRVAYGGGFELMAMRAPWLWREIYHLTDGHTDEPRWGGPTERLLFRRFRTLVRLRPWRVVLCTHFLPCQLAAGRVGVPFALTVTDYTLHRYWVQPGVHRYFVATRDMASELRRRAPLARVDATGIPVRDAFRQPTPRAEARAALGLDARRPAVLVMGGGMGLGVEGNAAALLRAGPSDLQILAVCGKNVDARRGLAALRAPADRLRVLGMVDDIPALMSAADLVVSKPGGLTCTEALALARPLVLTRPIPGHEEANVRAITAAGAAISAPTARDLPAAVAEAVRSPDRLRSLQAAAARLSRPDAADTIARAIAQEYALDRAPTRHAASNR